MKFRNVIIFIVVFSMLFLHSSFVCSQATVLINSQSIETNEESISEINTYNISGVDTSNYSGYIKPNNGSWDGDDDICQENYFASYYFKNLKDGYFGNNTHGSCGYVASAMLLSYYDTYLNDNIIDEKYDKEGTLPFDFDLSYSHESPGIEKEPQTATTSNGVNKDLGDFTAEEYWNYIEANWQNNFQLYLIKIAEEQYNRYHNAGITFRESGITWTKNLENPCASIMLTQKEVIEYYLYQERGYDSSQVSLEYNNSNPRDFAINKIKEGQPVLLFLGNTSGCHFVVAYDLDDNGTKDNTSDDKIYAHYGWGDDDTHININTDTYPCLISAMAINFTNSINHSHSNNYIGARNKEYCSCFYSDHPAHECSRYYKEYNQIHHTYACDCNPSEENLFDHNFVYGNSQIGYHEIYCSDCGYKKGTQPHDYQYLFENSEYHKRVCDICGHKHSQSVHKFVSTSIDNNYHAYVCEDCGYQKDNEPHNLQCSNITSTHHTYGCAECGYSVTSEHDMYTSPSISPTEHGRKCRDCGYVDESTVGTHSYNSFMYVSDTAHRSTCDVCGVWKETTSPHTFTILDRFGKMACIGCGYTKYFGSDSGNIILSITKVSANGSYILPDGTIVLVEEDIEAYLNGTLVFYDKNNVPQTQ